MSGKQQTQQETKPKVDKKPAAKEPASGEYVSQVEPLDLSTQADQLPNQRSNRLQRQASVLQLQRRLGNAYVQRFLARNGKPATIQKGISEIETEDVLPADHPSSNGMNRTGAGSQSESSPNGSGRQEQQESSEGSPEPQQQASESNIGSETSQNGRQEQQESSEGSPEPQQQASESNSGTETSQNGRQEQQEGSDGPSESQVQATESSAGTEASQSGRQVQRESSEDPSEPQQQSDESSAGSGSGRTAQGAENTGAESGAGGGSGDGDGPTQEMTMSGPPEEVVQQLLGATASQIAATHSQTGEQLGQALTQQQEQTKQETPPLKAKLVGVEDQPEKPEAPELDQKKAKIEEGQQLPEPPKPESKPHKEKAPPPKNEKMAEAIPSGAGEEPGALAQIKSAVSGVMNRIATKDPGIITTISEKPKFEATGKADPNRAQSQAQEGTSQVQGQGQAAEQNIDQLPGPETVQPQKVDEEKPVEVGEQAVQKPETPQQTELTEFAQMQLPDEVRQGVDAKMAPMLAQSLAWPRQEVAEAAQTRDQEKQAAILESEAEVVNARTQADQEQMQAVSSSRQEIQSAKDDGKKQNQDLVQQFDQEAGAEKEIVHGEVEQRIQEDRNRADDTMAKAEQGAAKEKQRGEQEVAAKKQELRSQSQNESWWEQVGSAVRSVVRSVTQAIDGVFTLMRNTIRNIIDTARDAAETIIDAGRTWVTSRLDSFRNWVTEKVDTYVGNYFPGVARAINDRIDRAVDNANNVINQVADTFNRAVTTLADNLRNSIDTILGRFQATVSGVIGVFSSLLTGDFAEAMRIAFETAAEIAGVAKGGLMSILSRAGDSIRTIFRDPVGFLGNLINAVTTGFNQFKDNIVNHLKKGFTGWLFGALEGAGLELPESFDLKGIFSLVMQVLGLTADRVRERLSEMIGDRGVEFLERTRAFVSRLMAGGPGGLFDAAADIVGDVKARLFEAIKTTIIDRLKNMAIVEIVQRSITRLITMFNPAGALIQAISSIYNVIRFVQERMAQIQSLGEAIFSSLASIVGGAVGGVATRIEQVLARSIPVAINFLARLVGLGDIAGRIRDIIGNVRERVDNSIERVLQGIIGFVSRTAGRFGESDAESEGGVGTENAGGTANSE